MECSIMVGWEGSGEQVSPLQNYVSLEVNSSWGGEKNESHKKKKKMRVHYRKWVSLEVYIHGLETMEETFV